MQKGKGKAFLEILALSINEDYRFPLLELLAFFYALSTFAFADFRSIPSATSLEEGIAYNLTASVLGTPLFIFIILVFKNLAYGLGSDIEKGIIQTYLSYPLKRFWILTAKLSSAIVIAILVLISIQISSLYLLAPDIVSKYLNTILLTYAANLSPILLISGIILLITLLLKRGGLALVFGIILYFAFSTISSIMMFTANAIKSPILLRIISLIHPNTALNYYYTSSYPGITRIWTPTISEVFLYIGMSYLITMITYSIAYIYFCRRFGT